MKEAFAPTQSYDGPTWSQDAERGLLSVALAAADRCAEMFEQVTPDHFYDPVHRRVWGAVLDLRQSDQRIDTTTVAHRLGEDRGLAEWGGIDQLRELAETADLFSNESNAGIVLDLALRRSIAALGRDTAAKARNTGYATGAEVLVEMEREAADIAKRTTFSTAWRSIGDMIDSAVAAAMQRDGLVRYPVGLRDVDDKLGGLNAGETTVVAAWTGMGKTIAGAQIAKGCGSRGLGVAYFSLEMADDPMAIRMACDVLYDRSAPAYFNVTSNITIDKALRGRLEPQQWARLREASAIVRDWPIHFDSRPGLSVAQIEAATVRLHREWERQGIPPGPVIVDHIGKVKPSTDRRGNVTAETRDVANDLDIMAKRLNVPVVALSQLNRLTEANTGKDKRPTLASIKDSGAVAENARQIIFIYRPEYYFREPFEHEEFEAKSERQAELRKVENQFYWIIEKNSNGPRAQVLTYCKADCSAVRDWNP